MSSRFKEGQRWTFVVTGTGSFPEDMMRYANASYTSTLDRESAERTFGTRKYDEPYLVKIDFEVNSPTAPEMVARRFESFGAKMVRCER